MKLEPIGDHTRRDLIADRLQDLVVSGQVDPGVRLTEVDLSEQLGVSRTSLREAIQQLVATGLLVSVPYKGLFVRGFTARDLEELYSFRTTLEKFAFRECWSRRTAKDCDDLRGRNDRLVAKVEAGDDPAGAIELELNLHGWAYELSGHRLLREAWTRLHPNLQFYFTVHQQAHQRPGPQKNAHEVYVEFATGDDLDLMLDHIDAHMRQGLERTLGFLKTEAPGEKGANED